jgi:enterochelin esterase-like enzyme
VALNGTPSAEHRVSRGRFLKFGVAGVGTLVVGGAVAEQLVQHDVLPGKHDLQVLEGDCSLAHPELRFTQLGPSYSGQFYSRARRQEVGYTIAYPPGHRRGDQLPLVVMLHGFGGNHGTTIGGLTPAQALALLTRPRVRPMALVTVDGGGGYWNPHPLDDPMGMVVHELIPLCRKRGLGASPHRIGVMGISMGGYGALLFAEKYPRLFRAVAAISPAIWTSYSQAQGVNRGAYASAADFSSDDVVTHAHALAGIPVRVASGDEDPFRPGVAALAAALPSGAVVEFSQGCHTNPFFLAQTQPSVEFLSRHLTVS